MNVELINIEYGDHISAGQNRLQIMYIFQTCYLLEQIPSGGEREEGVGFYYEGRICLY